MVERSRRETLAAIASGAMTVLAGCQFDAESTETEPAERGQRLTEYTAESVRHSDERALFADGEALPTVTRTDERQSRAGLYGHTYLTDGDDAADVTFGDTDEAQRLASFVAATDLDGDESVYLFSTPVEACYEVRLQRVTVDDNGPSAQFCRALLPADTACDAERRETVGYAIRLPVAGDEFSGHGSGMSSTCGRPPRPEPFDPTEAER